MKFCKIIIALFWVLIFIFIYVVNIRTLSADSNPSCNYFQLDCTFIRTNKQTISQMFAQLLMNIMVVHRKSVGSMRDVWLSICKCVVNYLFLLLLYLIVSYTMKNPIMHGTANAIYNISNSIYPIFMLYTQLSMLLSLLRKNTHKSCNKSG